MTTHAVLGASAAHRWRNCPGSNALSEGLPDYTTEAAAEGTVAHKLAEVSLAFGSDPHDSIGVVTEQDGWEITVDQEMAEGAALFADYVRERAQGKELFIEQKFDLDRLNPPGPMFGTGDAVIWEEESGQLEVVDFKYGAGVLVEPGENPQMFQYALGAVVETGKRPDKITVTIIQPRIEHEDGPIRSWVFDWDYLVAEKKVMFEDAAATLEPDAPLVVGSWCRWCKAKAVCPAQRANALSLAQDAFAVEPTFPEPGILTVEQLAEVLEKGPFVQEWLRAVGAYALNMAQAGETVPGFKLVEKRTNRRWVDDTKADTYLRNRKLKVDERFNRKLISPAQAEKALKGKSGPDLPKSLFEKPEGRAALAPLDDKRPERFPGVQEAFGVIAETSQREE